MRGFRAALAALLSKRREAYVPRASWSLSFYGKTAEAEGVKPLRYVRGDEVAFVARGVHTKGVVVGSHLHMGVERVTVRSTPWSTARTLLLVPGQGGVLQAIR